MSTIVTSQQELDAAIAAGKEDIVIDAPEGAWIRLEYRGSSHVVAWGSSHVVAWGSSHVVAWGSSHVEARDSSHVEARGSSHVEAQKYTAVHLHSARVKLDAKGAVVDLTKLDLNTTDDWIEFHGVEVRDGKAIVYKAVDSDLNAGRGYKITAYPIGETVTASDWRATNGPGFGLHFGHRPGVAAAYFNGKGAPRFLAVEIDVTSMVALGDKCKTQTAKVLYEVDRNGVKVEATK